MIMEMIEQMQDLTAFSLMEHVSNGVLYLDSDFNLVKANAIAASFFEKTDDEIIGADFKLLLGAPNDDFFVMIKSGNHLSDNFDSYLKIITASGRDILIKVKVLLHNDGTFFVIFTETLENDGVDDYVTQIDKMATLGQLAASVAHEIRNPLAGISTTAQVLKGKLDVSLREFIDVILNEINRLDNIVRELLDFARPKKTYMTDSNLVEVLQKVFVLIEAKIVKARVKVNHNYTKEDVFMVSADCEQMMQAFMNIILNAVAATDAGGSLTVDFSEDDENVKVEFADTGGGIPSHLADNLFKPFFTTKSKGVGLGLTVTKNIVEKHQGKIWFKSEPNVGTTFYITLPKTKKEV